MDKCASRGIFDVQCAWRDCDTYIVMKLSEAATGQQHSRRLMAAMTTCWSTVWVRYFCYIRAVNKFLEYYKTNISYAKKLFLTHNSRLYASAFLGQQSVA
jgi:hypothetical protein